MGRARGPRGGSETSSVSRGGISPRFGEISRPLRGSLVFFGRGPRLFEGDLPSFGETQVHMGRPLVLYGRASVFLGRGLVFFGRPLVHIKRGLFYMGSPLSPNSRALRRYVVLPHKPGQVMASRSEGFAEPGTLPPR